MKIALIGNSFGYNGKLMYYENIFNLLSERYRDCIILVREGFPIADYPKLRMLPGLRFVEFGLKRRAGGGDYNVSLMIPNLNSIKTIFGLNFDVVLCIEFTFISAVAVLVAWMRRQDSILLIEGHPSYRGANSILAKIYKMALAPFVGKFLVNSTEGQNYLISNLKINKDKVFVAPYLTSCPPSSRDKEKSITKNPNVVNILFLNNLTDRKGCGLLIKTLTRIFSRFGPIFHLHVVGDGPMRESLEAESASLVTADCVTFYGAKKYEEVHAFYSAADLFVSPTLADYRSLCGFEAISVGTPIILSKYDGASNEIFQRFDCGWTVDPLDEENFFSTIQLALINNSLLSEKKANAIKASAFYSYESIVDNIINTIKSENYKK